MTRVSLRFLGGFGAERDGKPVVVRSKKAVALLAYLAHPPRKPHPRDTLAALLWGEMDDGRARHNLRQCVSAIRKLFGDEVIVADGDALALGGATVDSAALDRAEQVDEVYRGELLEGFHAREEPFDEWLEVQRVSLRERASAALAALAVTEERGGRLDAAIAASVRRSEIDPSSEEAHRQLIRLYARAGQRSAALKQYEVCKSALRRHLDAEPSHETERLVEQLRVSGGGTGCDSPASPTAPSSMRVLPDRPSLAVLPLSGPDTPPDYFGIGLAEDITTALSKFRDLYVIAATAMRSYAGTGLDILSIGKQLGVHYVVRGTVLREAEHVRLWVTLLDAQTGNQVWAHRYDRVASNLFALQDEVTEQLVATIVGRVQAARADRARKQPTDSLAAYDCMLRGRDHHHRWTPVDSARAVQMFERAIELDRDYALGYAWLGCALGQRNYFEPDASWMARAFELIQQAHALDDAEPECYRMFAAYYIAHGDLDKAEAHQRRAEDLNPNDDRIACQSGELATLLGRPDEAVSSIRRAMYLNPYHPERYWMYLSRALYHAGAHAEALHAMQQLSAPLARDVAYMLAAAVRADRADLVPQLRDRLRQDPDCSIERLLAGLPFRRAADRDDVAASLRTAGLADR